MMIFILSKKHIENNNKQKNKRVIFRNERERTRNKIDKKFTPADDVEDDDELASVVVEYRVGEQDVEVDALVEHPHEVARLYVLE